MKSMLVTISVVPTVRFFKVKTLATSQIWYATPMYTDFASGYNSVTNQFLCHKNTKALETKKDSRL